MIETAKFAERLVRQKGTSEQPSLAELSGQFQHLRCVVEGKLLRLTLDRPRKRNAMNAELTGELERVVACLEATEKEVRVVIVAGAGEAFCAGDDVGDLPDRETEAADLSLRRGALFQQITELPQIFIAAIDGLCLGGGLVLASACDFRVATHRSQLGLPEVRLGWPPNYGMGIVQSLVGRSSALELALTGQPIDGQRAQAMGLVNRVVAVAQLKTEVDNLARQVESLPAEALAAAKRLLAPGSVWSDEVATRSFVSCLSLEAAKESRKRFR